MCQIIGKGGRVCTLSGDISLIIWVKFWHAIKTHLDWYILSNLLQQLVVKDI